jgi:hypothetical protein
MKFRTDDKNLCNLSILINHRTTRRGADNNKLAAEICLETGRMSAGAKTSGGSACVLKIAITGQRL